MSRGRKLPSICVDEHIPKAVTSIFRSAFRTIEAGRQANLRGRDERQYLAKLYAENTVFVTSDIVFADFAEETGLKHAGLIYVPNLMTRDEQEFFAEVAVQFLRGGCSDSPHAFRGCLLYPANDGLRIVKPKHRNELVMSWPSLFER